MNIHTIVDHAASFYTSVTEQSKISKILALL